MASNFVREIPSTHNHDEIRQNLEVNGNVLAFLEQVFDLFAEVDSNGSPVKLTAPAWWGLSHLMQSSCDVMNDAYSELK
ncbi:MAG: hypothetical protein AB7U59_12785 [Desulfovibrionaceae bacterium]